MSEGHDGGVRLEPARDSSRARGTALLDRGSCLQAAARWRKQESPDLSVRAFRPSPRRVGAGLVDYFSVSVRKRTVPFEVVTLTEVVPVGRVTPRLS